MKVFTVSHNISGCNGEYWFVVVAEDEERALELANEKINDPWLGIGGGGWGETLVNEVYTQTEGVKDYGGYIE